jgi:hypothetical protein
MSSHRRFKALLAAAFLTTGLIGCADLNQAGVGKDNLDTVVEKPGEQLLSNGAATAISDIRATFRDVDSLKNMASQQPLLSNSGGNLLSNAAGSLLSNSMGGYRIASTGVSQDDYARIEWTDSNAAGYPGETPFTGEITGKLDGVTVERYSYTVETYTETTYLRKETVHESAFRKTGLYQVTGTTTITEHDQFGLIISVTGSSTFDPDGLNRKLDYELNTWGYFLESEFIAFDAKTTAKGSLPNGSTADVTFFYAHEFPEETESQKDRYTLSAQGVLGVAGRALNFKTDTVLEGENSLTGDFRLGLAKDFWLSFDFASQTPLVASVRNDKGELLGALEYTEDKKKVVVNHPGEEKPEHLELSILPELYLLGIKSALPPI